MEENVYYRQARLLLQALPYVTREELLAIKGGTAINFFIRNLPRISVDIDLIYLPIEDRKRTLIAITKLLENISSTIKKTSNKIKIHPQKIKNSKFLKRLIIQKEDAIVKIEPNLVIRGNIFPCEVKDLIKDAQDLFEMFLTVKTLSFEELYGSKICAALDRQHPRDLFDIKILFDNEGITDRIRKAFIVSLISHNRPMNELLNPNLQDIKFIYDKEFLGMTRDKIDLEELIEVRKSLISRIKKNLTPDEKKFLISLKKKNPEWNLLGINGVEKLPAVKWKLLNIENMSNDKRLESLKKLENYIES
jgi:predicted nucleotidyltransferase component of viral defense system